MNRKAIILILLLVTKLGFVFPSETLMFYLIDKDFKPIEGCLVVWFSEAYRQNDNTTTKFSQFAGVYATYTDFEGKFYTPLSTDDFNSNRGRLLLLKDEFIPVLYDISTKMSNCIILKPCLTTSFTSDDLNVIPFDIEIILKGSLSNYPMSVAIIFEESQLFLERSSYYHIFPTNKSNNLHLKFNVPTVEILNHGSEILNFYVYIQIPGLNFWLIKHELCPKSVIKKDYKFTKSHEIYLDSSNMFNYFYLERNFTNKRDLFERTNFNETNINNNLIAKDNDSVYFFHNMIFLNKSVSPNFKFEKKVIFNNSLFANDVTFDNVSFNRGVFFDSVVFLRSLKFNKSFFDTLSFNQTTFFSALEFKDDKSLGAVNFLTTQLPNIVSFEDVTLTSVIWLRDINTSRFFNPTMIKMRELIAADHLNVIFSEELDFNILPKEDTNHIQNSKEKQRGTYVNLLKRAKDEGYTRSYEIIDKRYRKFQYLTKESWKIWFRFQNWIDKTWWDYGYNKQLIFQNTLFLFLMFVFFNIFLVKKMAKDVYVDKKINKLLSYEDPIPAFNFFKKIPISVYYTSIIFFVVSISLNRLKYKENLIGLNCRWLFYFGIMYLTGLVCLGYLVNYVITD